MLHKYLFGLNHPGLFIPVNVSFKQRLLHYVDTNSILNFKSQYIIKKQLQFNN